MSTTSTPARVFHAGGNRIALALGPARKVDVTEYRQLLNAILWTQTELTPPAPITNTVDISADSVFDLCARLV